MPAIKRIVSVKTVEHRQLVEDVDGFESAWNIDDNLRMVVYGESGTGKTTFWASFPKPILVLVCSGGNQPEELRSIDTPEMRKVVDPFMVSDSTRIEDFLDKMEKRYATVVLDHLSGLQSLKVKEILGLSRVPISAAGLVSLPQWGQIGVQCIEVMRKMLNMRCNCVIVGQQRHDKPKDDPDSIKVESISPGIIPMINSWLLPAVSYVVQTFKGPRFEQHFIEVDGERIPQVRRLDGVDYCLRTGPHDIIATKFRIPKNKVLPPPHIVLPRDVNPYDLVLAVSKGTLEI
jgi:hypothetical protein